MMQARQVVLTHHLALPHLGSALRFPAPPCQSNSGFVDVGVSAGAGAGVSRVVSVVGVVAAAVLP